MSKKEYHLHNGKKGAALAVRIVPRASRNEIAEILHDGTIRIRLTVPPTERETNDALSAFLAEVLGIPEKNIEIVAGSAGRDKLVSVLDMDTGTAQEKILKHLS